MPRADPYNTDETYFTDTAKVAFKGATATKETFADTTTRTWTVMAGKADGDEAHYGILDNGELVARIQLMAAHVAQDCPTPYSFVGMAEMPIRYRNQGIGTGLLGAVFKLHGHELASDLVQSMGAVSLWKGWIRQHPGKVELYDDTGSAAVVTYANGQYAPAPWSRANENKRLVRKP